MRKTVADVVAIVLAAGVLVLGGLAVVKPALDHWGDVSNRNPFEPRTTTEETKKEIPGKPTETTTQTKEATGSFVERALGDSGLLLLRIAIVVLAAFLAGAAGQRLALGEFALKVGPVEVPAVTSASENALAAVKSDLQRLVDRMTKLETFRRSALGIQSDTQRGLATLAEEIAELERRVDALPEDQAER